MDDQKAATLTKPIQSISKPSHWLGKLPVMTIRTRLTLWYSSLLATVIVIFGISSFSILNWTWRNQVRDSMLYIAQQTVDAIIIDPLSGRIDVRSPRVLDLLSTYPYAIQVRDAQGNLVRASSGLGDFTQPFDSESLKSTEVVTRDSQFLGKTHALVLTTPVHAQDGATVGTVQILSEMDMMDAATDRLFRVVLGVGTVALLLAFMVGSVIAGQALQPIDTISQAAKQITASGDLSKRIKYQGPPDELGQLTVTFNRTLERLEKLFLTQRRFVADVSHELRTPLTTIQGNIDLLKRYGSDPVSLEAIDGEVKRMSRLVGDLLLLAQADSGRLPLLESTVELGTLAWEVFKQAQVLAQEVELRLGAIEAVHVRGDEDRLKQLLLNLVSNAIKYTPAGGRVTINVVNNGEFAVIQVTDTGIGIPKDDLEHVFDRFYRVDKARSRQMGGTGLGLSIASWIVEAHHGRIWAESEIGKGSTFIVELPSLDAPAVPEAARETRPRLAVPSIPIRRWSRPDSKTAASERRIEIDEDAEQDVTPMFPSSRRNPGSD